MRIAALFAFCILAGCTTARRPYAPVHDIRYQALGSQPVWLLTIGDDRIVLRTGPDAGEQVWPRTLPRTHRDMRIWRSGEGAGAIVVEASEGPCTGDAEREYEDHVRVTVGELELTGCGGPLLRAGRGG